MKQLALAVVALVIALVLGALWYGGLLDGEEAPQGLDLLEVDDDSVDDLSASSSRESIDAPQPARDASSATEGNATPSRDGSDEAAPVPAAAQATDDGPQLLSHYLSDTRPTMTWATELTLVFDRPLQLVVVGKGPFEVDGSQARGALWTIERRSDAIAWRATGEDGTSSSGTLTVAGVVWDELFAWIPEGFEATDGSEPGDQGWATRVREPRSGIVFCLIPSGVAPLGYQEGGGAMTASKVVRFAEPFYMARTETTQAQWKAVRETNPGTQLGDEFPVDSMSWNDAKSFCESIGTRLPDNVQWEYACLAGARTTEAFDDMVTDAQAKFMQLDDAQEPRRHPREGSLAVAVASYPPNAWGLHDMLGNLSEWTARASAERSNIDWGAILATDPEGTLRSIRGGSWIDPAHRLHSWLFELERADGEHLTYVGFRACWVRE